MNNIITALLVSFSLIFAQQSATACSMYKLTIGDKTMVGCNEDAWRTTSKIWFENAKDDTEYGAGFTGSRRVGTNKYAPQSGMNEVGLVFSRLTAYHPKQELGQAGKKQIRSEVQYLSDILHKCKTVDEVKQYIAMYDHSFFLEDVFIYVDKSGDYLVVEPYKAIKGTDPSYVLANFCPSLTNEKNARKQTRYKNGDDFLKVNGLDTTLNFCTAMSDTMHVCRNRNGDGTLLTSIWDTQNGLVNLYFYHRYDTTVQFKLSEELALGDHILSIPSLFPKNAEFERLIAYKTPFNVPFLRLSLVFIGGFLFFLSFLYLISFFWKRNTDKFNGIKLLFSGLNVLLVAFLFILATHKNIYYFDAPYQHYNADFISLSSYIPPLLLLLIIPLSLYNIRYIKVNRKRLWIKSALIVNNILYLMLLISFGYWGFFHLIN